MSRKGMFGMEKNYQALRAKSFALRQKALDMVYRAKTGHIGGDFSVCDILNVLYNSQMNVTPENFDKPGHDHLILSKGHSVEARAFFRNRIWRHFLSLAPNISAIPTTKSMVLK